MIRKFKKDEIIPKKEYLYSQPYKENFYVVVKRSDQSNQDGYGMYLVDKSGKVLHSFGSHPSLTKEKVPEKQLDKMLNTAKEIGENMVRENAEVKNPFIDSVYNGNFTKIKEVAEKTVAEKIYNRVQEKKKVFLDKVIGR
jgi:Tat protein secretion system quality control protein TatD with DNase activity